MKLLQSLTEFLTSHDVKRVESWAEDGEIIFSPGGDQGMVLRYTANFELSHTNTNPIRLFTLVMVWINKHNLERQTQGLPHPQFFSERLDGDHYELGIRIEFEEQYQFQADEQGAWMVNEQRSSMVSSVSPVLDLGQAGTLELVDAHTQDHELQSHAAD